MPWRMVIPALAVLQLVACGATIHGDKSSATIDCNGWLQSWSDCVAAADDLCFDNRGYVARWYEDSADGRVMRVRCGGA